MIIQITCPSCGSQIEIDNSREFMFCKYCGTKIYGANITGANMGYAPDANAGYGADPNADPYEEYGAGANVDFAPVSDAGYTANANTGYTAAQNYPANMNPGYAQNTPNLTISYSTTQPQYPLTVMLDGQKWVFPDQAVQGFNMTPGVHTVTFYIARRGWRKIVNIPPTGVPVRVSVVYAGRTKIYIQ